MPDSASPDPLTQSATGISARIVAAAGAHFLQAVSRADCDEVALFGDGLLAAVDALRGGGYNLLLDIGVTDHQPLTPRFEVSYHFLSMPLQRISPYATAARFRLRVFPSGDGLALPSLTGRWPNADWAEREAFDMFGVTFDGHPKLTRILMPDDWEGYPLRKDYPLRGFDRLFNPGGRLGAVPPVVES
ncbi:MAG: NADH-quinone oxidoreductase subunit C [Candidatus Eremiobacteraeota bacterium]|nr:NADH-quinone oxidoreductase subunit C [Candidatus Eremiobacteraeota bacterium]MBC5826848.1 NADH-quinone oxidoreductase subunit C [Candidatus Eremiobacteraeota bacterium]